MTLPPDLAARLPSRNYAPAPIMAVHRPYRTSSRRVEDFFRDDYVQDS